MHGDARARPLCVMSTAGKKKIQRAERCEIIQTYTFTYDCVHVCEKPQVAVQQQLNGDFLHNESNYDITSLYHSLSPSEAIRKEWVMMKKWCMSV